MVIVTNSFVFGCSTHEPKVRDIPPMEATAATVANVDTTQESRGYVIRNSDELDIKFFYNPELDENVVVRPDGKISLQLVDDVRAAGLTPSELDDVLTARYSQELRTPAVTVIVRTFAGDRVFVGGEVETEQLLDLRAGLTALQAVIEAGGFTEGAKPSETILIRKGSGGRPTPMLVNLNNVIGSGGSDVELRADDVVFVPKTTIARANKWVEQYISRLILFRGVGLNYNLNDLNLNL